MALGCFPACAQAWTHQAEQKPPGQRNPLLQVPQGACLLDGPTLQPHIPYASDPISCCSCLLPGAGDELGYQHLALPTLLRCSGAVPKGEGPAVPGVPWVRACPPCQAVLLPPTPQDHCSERPLPSRATSTAPPTSRDFGVVHRQVGICFNGDLVVIDIAGALQEDGKCWDSCCRHCSSSPKHSCEVIVHSGAPADVAVPGAPPGPHSTLTLGTGQRYWHRQKPAQALGAVNPRGMRPSVCTCTSPSTTTLHTD